MSASDVLLVLLAFGVLIGPLALARWLLDRADRRSPPGPPRAGPTHPPVGHHVPRSGAHRRRLP